MGHRVVYFRRSAGAEWELRGVVKTRKGKSEHSEAMALLTEISKHEKAGNVAYLEVDAPVSSTWDLRHLIIRMSFVNAACKSFLKDSWKLIASGGSKHYVPTNPNQTSLFEGETKSK